MCIRDSGISLLDRDRDELSVVEIPQDTAASARELRIPVKNTLSEWVVTEGAPRRVDDVADPGVPGVARSFLSERGFRSAVLVPLVSGGETIGTLTVTHRAPGAFSDGDVEALAEMARPLASAVEHARLHAETVGRAQTLAALNRTAQLITSRLD